MLLVRWWAVLFFVAVCAVVTVVQPYDSGPPIRADGLGYHAAPGRSSTAG